MSPRLERLRRRFSEAPASVPPEHRRYYSGANLAYPVGLLWHLAFIFIFWAVGAAPLAVREFYGKVVRGAGADGAPALVRSTAVPPEIDAYFQGLWRYAPRAGG